MKKYILIIFLFFILGTMAIAATGEIKKVSSTGTFFIINLGGINGIKIGSKVTVYDENNEKIALGEVTKVEHKSALVRLSEIIVEGKKIDRGMDVVVDVFETDDDFVKSFEEGEKPGAIKTFYDTEPYFHNFSLLFGTYKMTLDGFSIKALYGIKLFNGFLPQITDPFYLEFGFNMFYFHLINDQITGGITPKYLSFGIPLSIRWDMQVWEYLTLFVLGGTQLNIHSAQITKFNPDTGLPDAARPKKFYVDPVVRLGLSINVMQDMGIRLEGSWDFVGLGVLFRF